MPRSRYCQAGAGLVIVATLFVAAPAAAAEPFDLVGDDDIAIDLTTDDDPTLELELQREDASAATEAVITLAAGSPLGTACDFVAGEDDLPQESNVTETVTFTIRDGDLCNLADADFDEVNISSTSIDDVNATASLERDPSFPFDDYAGALRNAVVAAILLVAVATLFAVIAWCRQGNSFKSFWIHPLDSPTLAWSFNESWLTNLTALGALLATLLGITDVLDVIGPDKPDRAVFLLVNFGGVVLAAASLIAYLALRGYNLKETKPARVPMRLQVAARPVGADRRLRLEVPTVSYLASQDGQIGEPGVDPEAPVIEEWQKAGHHIAVLAIPARVANNGDVPTPPPALVALEVPSKDAHTPTAVLMYDVSVPQVKRDMIGEGDPYAPAMTTESRIKAHGRMGGFVVAGLLATVGVSLQLASISSVLGRAELSGGATVGAFSILAVVAAFAVVYVFGTIVKRLPEVDSAVPTPPPASSTLPRELLTNVTGDPVEPVVPAAVVNTGVPEEGSDAYPDVPPSLVVAPSTVAPSYPITGTSVGDESSRRETAF